MAPILGAATGWLLYAALSLALGSVAARFVIVPRISGLSEGAAEWLGRAGRRQAVLGALLLSVAMALVFVRQLVEFRDPFVPWTEDAHLLLAETAWGVTWHLGMGGALLALVAFVVAGRAERMGWLLGGATVLGLGAFPAFTGHASGAGPLRPLTLAADTLHVWAAGAWIGGLVFVLYAARGAREAEAGSESLLPLLVPVFSPLAVVCVATLAATGSMAAWIHLAGLGALVTTPYGWVLSAKLVLAFSAMALGFVNWRRLTPRLGEGGGRSALTRAATVEPALAQAVLVVTAVLVRTPPPVP